VGYGQIKGGKFGLQNGETYGLTNAPFTAKDGFNSTSVIGFRGVEDLGGGMKANFNLQTGGFDLGSGSTPLAFSRESNVGLEGGFGAIQFGRTSSVAAKTMGGFDLNGTSGSSALANAGVSAVTWYGSSRRNDQMQYTAPKLGDVTVRVGLTLANDSTANGVGVAATQENRWTVGLSYAKGPLAVGAVVETKQTSALRNAMAVGVSYNFGVARVAAAYNKRERAGTVGMNQFAAGATANAAVQGGKGYSLGVVAPMGPLNIGAQYGNNSDTKVKATELFANYALSKRTRVYVDYVTTSGTAASPAIALGTGASLNIGQVGLDAVPAKTNALGLGIVHTF
jgi:predicted porin